MLGDGRRRGQQSHNFRQLETGQLLVVCFSLCSLELVCRVWTRPQSFPAPETSVPHQPSLTSSDFDIVGLCFR